MSYYNPLPTSDFYYVPLRKTGPKEKRWVNKRKYSSSGLQKTRTTTFAGAFIHPRNKSEWAWTPDYLSKLVSLANDVKVPTFDLAAWMFRDRDWSENTQPTDIVNYFLSVFNITEEEKQSIFDTTLLGTLPFVSIFQKEPITWKVLRRLRAFHNSFASVIVSGFVRLLLGDVPCLPGLLRSAVLHAGFCSNISLLFSKNLQ